MEELCANKSKQMKKAGCKLKKMKNKWIQQLITIYSSLK